jgi:geranylgeranyl pyrophosphate synthase
MPEIYTDFSKNMDWIRGEFRKHLSEIPEALYEMTSYYLVERIGILPNKTYSPHPKYGTPMPYIVFWFADALGLKKNLVNRLALSLMYANTFYCLRDDLIDGRNKINGRMPDEHEHIALANFFFAKYLAIFKDMFPSKSLFWSYLVSSINDWWQHEYWSYLFDARKSARSNPLSKEYLANSSRYIVGITAPSVIAIALLTGNKQRIHQIQRFLTHYFMGYRIADDLRDWVEDLQGKNYNRSTVIQLAQLALRGKVDRIDENGMISFFLETRFREMIYHTIEKHYLAAKKEVFDLHSFYLNDFVDSQISYFEEENNYYAGLDRTFEESTRNILQSVIEDNTKNTKRRTYGG